MGVFDETWDFPSLPAALAAFFTWNPEKDREPTGWHRHRNTQRYRIGGDPHLEYVKIHQGLRQDWTIEEQIADTYRAATKVVKLSGNGSACFQNKEKK
jgi:hypothetical protein